MTIVSTQYWCVRNRKREKVQRRAVRIRSEREVEESQSQGKESVEMAGSTSVHWPAGDLRRQQALVYSSKGRLSGAQEASVGSLQEVRL